MKKHFYLTLLLALFSAATAWAAFAPEEGKMYALKETTSGWYLDIQTLGIIDATAKCDNVSLNAIPCVIYFEAGTNDGTWKLKNSNGMYVYYTGDNANGTIWNPRIGTAANQVSDWYVTESGGKITISREATGSYINVGEIEAGKPLYCSNSTGMTFTLMEISYSYELGDIKSSDDLMAATTATHIAVKNCANNNSYYLAGTGNKENWESAILVWEPVTDGTPGTYYLRTTDATNGYIQSATAGTEVSLGTKTGAQEFYTTEPTGSGSGPTLCNAIDDLSGADTDNLVRFVQNGSEVWLNCQNNDGKPKYTGTTNNAYGVWTVHNVYAVNVTTKLTEVVFDPYVLLKTSSGTYLSTTSVASDTHLSIQAEGTKFVLETSQDGNGYYIKVLNSSPAEYVSTYSSNLWGASTSTTAYKWIISDPDTDGYVTISRDGAPTYCLGTTYTPAAGTAVYSNAGSENGTPNKWFIEEYNMGAVGYNFQITNPSGETVSATYNGNAITAGETIEIEGLVDKSLFDATDVEGYAWSVVVNNTAKTITIVYVEKYNGSYYLKTSSGTYLNLTPHASLTTSATFQATGTEFYIEPSGDNYYITQLNSNPVKYFTVSSSNEYDVTTSTTAFAWSISQPDANDFVTITKASNSDHHLGHDGNQNAGTGVFANVGTGCNTWQLVKVGPLDYTFAITNPTGEAVSATYNGNAISAGATISIDGRVDTSLFSTNEIEGYFWKVELDPDTRTITLVYEKKYNWSVVGLPDGAAVTYNSAAVADGGIVGVDYDSQYLAVTCPNGYTWAVTRDDENKIITITFTQLQSEENPQSVVELLNRIGGEGTADKFKIVLDPSINYDQETFVIGSEDNKVLIKGTTISAITTGIGWYLQNIAHINIAWNSLNEKTADGGAYADLSSLPMPTGEETHTGDAIYRYYLNYCTFGYSMTTWTWKRWQQEIDWMALHGINMPLQIIGLEEVWRKFLTLEENGARKYNYTDEEAKAFVPGPAFTAWWGMNNLEGWGGTDAGGWGGVQDDDWYTRQQQLATDIVTRQRELGMQPVLPGFSGMVPSNFQTKTGVTCDAGSWCGFTRPKIVLPSNARFAEIAADYYKCLKEVMGESKYYSIDPFHEGGSISGGTNADYDAAYAAIYQAMEQAKPGSLWVIQQWQWSDNNHQRRSLNAVPAGRLVVLDLFSDGKPFFDSFGTNGGYAPQDAVFCAIPNFGGRSGIMARLTNLANNYFHYKGKYSSIKGVGAAPEAIEQTPVTYDLIFQLPWMGSKPDVAEWVDNYSIARYGKDNAEVKEAWSLLRQGVLNYGADAIQGPVEDVWAARPNLDATPASSWGSTISKGKTPAQSTYTKARRQMLIDATYRLLGQKDALELVAGSVYESNYSYDIVEMGGGVLADYAHDLLLAIGTAKTAAGSSYNDDATYIARRDAFLALIADVDEFKGTNLNFRLGKWTQEARDAAGEVENATTATPDWYEYNNARTIITTWGDQSQNGSGGLRDYSYRSWQGLLKDYYLPRWQYYFNNNCTGPSSYFFFEWNWAHGKTHAVGDASKSTTALAEGATGYSYSREPEGNTVEKANEVLGKYIIPVKLADGSTYYAYRYLSDDLSLTLTTTQGATLDLSEYITFGNTDGLTMSITSNLIDGTATDLSAVTIKADACGDADSVADVVTVALSDGTSLTLTVVVETSALATAKEELATLIEQMETLTSQVATFDVEGYKEVVGDLIAEGTAGTTNLYVWTNAQEDEEGPIKNLVDGSVETHFHSEYKTNVGAYHFINVDLGSEYALSSFKFSYSTRKAETNFPKTIEVSGCNEREGEYKYLATFTDLPVGNTTSAVEYVSDRIVAAQKYAYLRFTVTANNSGGTEGGGHPFFHMSEFNLYKASTTATVFKIFEGTELTNDFAAGKYDVLLDAMAVYENAATAGELTDATTALQQAYNELKALYDALDAKLQYIDEGVYKINYGGAPLFIAHSEPIPDAEKSKTGDAAGYKLFDGTTSNTAEVNKETHQAIIDAQAGADALFTITHNGAGYSLSAQGKYLKSTTTGYWGVLFFSDDEAEAGVYLFEETENDAYKLKSNNDDFQYVNDWGEYFGNDQSNKENLSTFTLTPVTEYTVTVDESRYTTLCLPFNVVLPAGVTAYDVVDVHLDGLRYEYRFAQVATEGQVLAKNTPVVIEADAADYVFNITMSDEDAKGSADGSVLRGALVKTTTDAQKHNYELAVVDGDAAFAKMLGNEVAANSCWLQLDESKGNVIYSVNAEDPKVEVLDGAVYRIKGRLSTGDMRTLYTNGGNKTIKWAADGTKDDVSTLFVAQKVGENQFKFVSVLADGVWNQDAKLGEDGVTLTLYAGSATGTFMLVGENNRLFCVDNEDLDFFSGAGIGGATVNENVTTDFVFEEEVERTYVKYTLTMAKDHKWATLYLPYEVVVPEGVEAYIAHTPDSEKMLLQPTGGVVPAYTPVVIYRDADEAAETKEYVFYYTAAAPAVAAEVENALTGKLIETVVEGKEDYRYYMLLTIDAEEAFYWILEEYDANGNLYPGGDKGYIKCAANKAYMELAPGATLSASYSFRFPGTTGVDGVEAEAGEVDAIYDLQGRKLLSAPEKGVYIVNGKLIVK